MDCSDDVVKNVVNLLEVAEVKISMSTADVHRRTLLFDTLQMGSFSVDLASRIGLSFPKQDWEDCGISLLESHSAS